MTARCIESVVEKATVCRLEGLGHTSMHDIFLARLMSGERHVVDAAAALEEASK